MNIALLLPVVPLVAALARLSEAPPPRTLVQIAAAVPREMGRLGASEPDEIYDTENIYAYINGAAEVYLAYGMRACLARRWAHPAGGLVLDLFEMADAAGAFGAFTYDQDGEPLDIGQGALLREGWLTFWQGRFFVSITAEGSTANHREGVLAIARATAAAIAERGELPELVGRLPRQGLQPRSLRYLRHPSILATHLPVGPGDPLALGSDAEAALARYENGALLLIVRYPSTTRAATGLEGAQRVIAAPAPAGRGGFWGAATADVLLALVGEAESEGRARQLLAMALSASQQEGKQP